MPTVGTSSRRHRHEAIDARGDDQEEQEKSDLQGKIQFYQKFSARQQQAVAEQRRAVAVVGATPSTASSAAIANNSKSVVRDGSAPSPCRFSTFKSGIRRGTGQSPDPDSLELASLGLEHRNVSRDRNELSPGRNREYYQAIARLREPTSNAEARRLDKQSYFFHGHKTEKNVDREVTILEDNVGLGMRTEASTELSASVPPGPLENSDDVTVKKTSNFKDTGASATTMSCFRTVDRDRGSFTEYEARRIGGQKASTVVTRRLVHEPRRDSGNVEFTEREGEIFRKNSNEFLQATSTGRRRNFSFRSKEKTHRSLVSLERSVDYAGADAKSLDGLPDETPKEFFHAKQRSLDSSQKSKKSADSSLIKPRKRTGFFQRVGRSLHFLPRERERCEDLLDRQEQRVTDYPQTDQEKCEYFLRRHRKDMDFFKPATSPANVSPQLESHFFDKRLSKRDASIPGCRNFTAKQFDTDKNMTTDRKEDKEEDDEPEEEQRYITFLDEENFRPLIEDQITDERRNYAETLNLRDEKNSYNRQNEEQRKESPEVGSPDQSASFDTHETTSGNKDSLEIGYSISQLGRLYLQNLQNASHTAETFRNVEMGDGEKRDRYLDWIAREDLDALSHRTNSTDSLGRAKPQGNLDILKGILLDLFVCICI